MIPSRDRGRSALALGALLVLALFTLGSVRSAAPSLTITPPTLTLGPVFSNQLAQGTLLLINDGDSVLTLGDLSVSDPVFDIGSRSSTIPPGTKIDPAETLTVDVSFLTAVQGTTTVTLTVPSDDPVNPEQTVSLVGIVLTAPSVAVSPDSLNEALGSGLVVTRDLSITNVGAPSAADLTWTISVIPVAGSGRAAGPLDGISILWDRTHGQTSTTGWRTLADSLEALGATVTEIPPASGPIDSTLLSNYNMYWTVDASAAWSAEERTALGGWVLNGGGVLLLGDNGTSLPNFNAVLTDMGSAIRYSTVPAAGMSNTTAIQSHPVTQGISSVYIGVGPRTLTVPSPASRLFDDVSGNAVGAVENVGLGRIVAYSDEVLDDVGIASGTQNLQLGLQTVEWLVSTSWLSPDVTSGAVAPGSTQVVTLTFDTAGLGAGEFDVNLRITSNDAVNPALDIPVHLAIAGVPDIDVVPAALAFGSVPVLTPGTDSVVVHNVGDDTLNVSGASTDGVYFATALAPFTLPPAESAYVVVTFTPDSLGAFGDTLRISSDDPDEAEVRVSLAGTGRVDCNLPCLAPFATPRDANGAANFLFPVDVEISGNPGVIRSFGFTMEYDPALLQFSDTVNAGNLTQGFVVSAQENQPGVLTCGAFTVSDSIPADTTGTVAQLWFRVTCPSCSLGSTSELILDNFTNDFAGLSACCGLFTLSACPTGTGDVNTDDALTPQDALCALKIFLNGGAAPPDSQCDGNGDCEPEIADADCDGQVTPGDALAIQDAWLAGLSPSSCIGASGGGRADGASAGPTAALSWGTPRPEGDEVLVLPLVAVQGVPRAFGLEVSADPDRWEWIGMTAGPEGGWTHLEAGPSDRGGARDRIRLGGLDAAGASRRGTVAELRFRRRPESGADPAGPSGIRVERAFDIRFDGAAEPGSAGGPVARPGLVAVGPVPTSSSLEVRFGVGRTSESVDLRVVDVSGRRVRQLAAAPYASGEHRIVWDGRDDSGRRGAAGIYFVRLQVGEETWTRKVVLLR
ncbi:MAG: choice-of-anchor D domain-containing protein [Gemmatimonadetes bacterium]|nr:choice-of-anchor D domain-containing protein [Gemmatimonadota bacterium]